MATIVDPSERAEKLITKDEVVALATDIATETVAYYQRDEQFRVDQVETEAGREYWVYWSECVPADGVLTWEEHGWALAQRLTFSTDGKLTEILSSPYSSNESNRYGYDEDNNLYLEEDSNEGRRFLRAIFDGDEITLREHSTLQRASFLKLGYVPTTHGDVKGFELAGVALTDRDFHDNPLPEADVAKLLPSGRFISLEDLVRTTVDPYRSNQRFKRLIPDVSKTPGFPNLDTRYRLAGLRETETIRTDRWDRSLEAWVIGKVNGNVHRLGGSEDYFDWLALMSFTDDEGVTHARALHTAIAKSSISVGETASGVPTVKGLVDIEGEQFELEVPEDRVTFVKITEVGGRKIDTDHPRREDSEYVTVHINVADLIGEVEKGYYMDDLLKTAFELYRQKHYATQES